MRVFTGIFVMISGGCAAPTVAMRQAPVIDGSALVGPPPAEGSARAAADRLSMHPRVSEARFVQAREDLAFDRFAIFRPVLGAEFGQERLPHTDALLRMTIASVGPAVNEAKRLHPRLRPYAEDRSLLRCDNPSKPSTDDSYPTGHGAGGWALALVLAELLPSKADALLMRGRDFGESRVICGYHFPSDVESSRLIAAGGVARLHGDAEYRKLLEAARAELARAYSQGR